MGIDYNKHIWEGWTVQKFIDDLDLPIKMIMNDESIYKRFTNKKELSEWCQNHQPYYKKSIPEVNSHFARMYNLK